MRWFRRTWSIIERKMMEMTRTSSWSRTLVLTQTPALSVQGGLVQEHEQQVYRNAKLPDKWPALDRILLDDEQRLWVSTISDDEEHYTWWVLDEAGKLLASFKWPGERLKRHISSENRFEVIRDGYVYSRELNAETELQEIVRYRIEQWPSE